MNLQSPQPYIITLSNGTVIHCPYDRGPAADYFMDCVRHVEREEEE